MTDIATESIAAKTAFTSSPYEPKRPAPASLDEINLLDHDLYRTGDPHAAWKMLRDQAPVFWHRHGSRGTDGNGFWVLSRYDDIAAVYRNSALYSSECGPFLDLQKDDTPPNILASIDGHPHRARRGIVAKLFTPQAIKGWNESVRRIVDGIIDEVIEKGECDFSRDIAHALPIKATCELLGISAEEARRLIDMLFSLDPGSIDGLGDYNRATAAFFLKLAKERQAKGEKGTMVDLIASAQIEGEPIADDEIAEMLWILFFGGIDSTVHAITGSLLTLFHHPDQLEAIRRDPSLAWNGTEEMLRWTSTSHANKRQAIEDTEIGGKSIRKGDYVTMWSPSANRDENVFPEPFRFDLERKFERGRAIATFGGGGPHQCIGQFFARLELQILFEAIFERMPDIAPAGPAIRSDHFTILLSPIEEMPVRFTPGKRVFT
jgi:cholest-4-en-3-one 26-monooxygenase